MKRLAKLGLWGLLILALLGTVAFFGGRRYLARSVATYDGEIRLPDLGDAVEVSFDARGIPRVRARTDADLYYAIGYLHASERLFQMELVRRLAFGELSEIFGRDAYDTDVRQRQLGFGRKARRDAETLSAETRVVLERYTAGINAWIRRAEVLPPEFVVLRFKPRDWVPEDCLALALYQTWYSHHLMASDEAYETLLSEFGESIGTTLEAPYPWSPPTVGGTMEQLLGGDPFPLRSSQASNSWAVAPTRSASGKAIHAADPHLSIDRAPGLWYLASLHSDEGLDVVGVMQPGLPLVVMGHNAHISYAFTVASLDIVDTFDEVLIDGSPAKVMTSEGPVAVETASEQIFVKGETGARQITVEIGPNGPLIERGPEHGVSIHWAGFDSSVAEMIESGVALMRVDNFDDFRRLVTKFGALDANWIYSDREGHVGYQLGVPIPIRDYEKTFARQKGNSEAAAWRGYVELDDTPHAIDPPAGWVASCNNQLVGPDWPYPMPGFYDPYRIPRVAELLADREDWTSDDTAAVQLDVVSGRALRWKSLAADAADDAGLSDLAILLREWDGSMSTNSAAAAVFSVWWETLGKVLFFDELGDDWAAGRTIQEKVLAGGHEEIVDDHRTPDVETLLDVASAAMSAAVALTQGNDYGDLSTLRVSHPLSGVRILDLWLGLSRGPVPVGGDRGSIAANFNRFDEETGTFSAGVGPSMRFVLDWADVDAFTINVALGQSGNPFSPHYDDFFLPSLEGKRWNVPFSKEKQKETEASLLRLVP